MQQVVLTVDIGGTRDRIKWPPRGTLVELPDEEAETMLANGYAATLKQARKHEEKTGRSFVRDVDPVDMVKLAERYRIGLPVPPEHVGRGARRAR